MDGFWTRYRFSTTRSNTYNHNVFNVLDIFWNFDAMTKNLNNKTTHMAKDESTTLSCNRFRTLFSFFGDNVCSFDDITKCCTMAGRKKT